MSSVTAAELTDDEAVESGRNSLHQYWDFPWYDEQKDSARPIDLPPQPAPTPPSASPASTSLTSELLVYVGWTVLALVVLAIIVVVMRLEPNTSMPVASGPEEDSGPVQPDRVEALPFALPKHQSDFFAAAEQAYQAGDFSTAVIYLYSYELLQLDKAQVIHLTRGKTNRQYLREARRGSTLAPLLEQSMLLFEAAFFGKHVITRGQFEVCWQEVPQFRIQIQNLLKQSTLAVA